MCVTAAHFWNEWVASSAEESCEPKLSHQHAKQFKFVSQDEPSGTHTLFFTRHMVDILCLFNSYHSYPLLPCLPLTYAVFTGYCAHSAPHILLS